MTPDLPGYVPPDPEEGMRPIEGGFPLDEELDPDIGEVGHWSDDTGRGRAWFFHEMRHHDPTHDEHPQINRDENP